MTELKLGFITTEEMAEWALLTPSYLNKNKKKWCEKHLTKYAKYQLKYGGVEIIEIFNPTYHSPLKTKVSKAFDSCWGNGREKIDKCTNAANKIRNKINDPDANPNTIYQYTCTTKREFYGVPKKRGGIKGDSRYVLCKWINGEAYSFTEEEEKIKKELMSKYLQTREQQVIDMRAAKEAYLNHEITKEEYNETINSTLDTDVGWIQFIEKLQEAIDAEVGFGTLLEDNILLIRELGDKDFEF